MMTVQKLSDTETRQFEVVQRSKAALHRAATYEKRVAGHLAALEARIAAGERQSVSATIGETETAAAIDVAALRVEAAAVTKQHRMAVQALAGIEAEHVRHSADLAAIFGPDVQARAALAEAHAERARVSEEVDKAQAILGRARAHASLTEGRLSAALAAEREFDQGATARLQAALQSGSDVEAVEPVERLSAGLAGDHRTATLTVERLVSEHGLHLDVLAQADRAVAGAIDGVLAAEADALARELMATHERAAMLRRRLTTYAERFPVSTAKAVPQVAPLKLNPGGWYDRPMASAMDPKVRQSTAVQQALRDQFSMWNDAHLQGPGAINWTVEAGAWTDYAAALTSDAAAEPAFARTPPYPPVLSSLGKVA